MFCPQCGTGLGEGARGCAACGWTSSRKTLWIVLGCIFGGLLLVCCGVGTLFFFRARTALESRNPPLVFLARVQVLQYGKKHGSLPESLEKAWEEPIDVRQEHGGNIRTEEGGAASDTWGNHLRYSPGKDGSYEVRSAGPDGQFDNADDIVEKGNLSDDLEAMKKEAEVRFEKIREAFMKALWIDPEKVKEGKKRRREKAGPPEEPKPPEAPPMPEDQGAKPPESPR